MSADGATPLLSSLAPVVAPNSRVLVLGTMPGERSIKTGEYYAHPRNALWKVMGGAIGFRASLPYADRLARITASGLALWDVLASCERNGSLDAAIREPITNDFKAFCTNFPRIKVVLFNGGNAADLWRRHVDAKLPHLVFRTLPSTSPANARVSFDQKRAAWTEALREGEIVLDEMK